MLNISFWLTFIYWAFLPDTRTPRFEIASIPVNVKDIITIIIALLYLILPHVKGSSDAKNNKNWHKYLPFLTVSLLLYAGISIEWSGLNNDDTSAMLYSLILAGAACLFGYYLIAKKDFQSIHSFLWKLTIFLSIVGLLYSAESFFSLGLGTYSSRESSDFGIQRVGGPLFVSTTGGFILVPALGFAIEEVLKSRNQLRLKLFVIFSLMFTIIGLGSRGTLAIVALLFILMTFFIQNKKQSKAIILTVFIVTATACVIFFSRAKTERLQSLEDESRQDTHLTSFTIIEKRSREDINTFIFGSGYGSYWSWYLQDFSSSREEVQEASSLITTPYGYLLYHPHSTFLLCILELGIPGLIFFASLWIVLIQLLLVNFRNPKLPIFNSAIFASAFSMFFDFFIFRSTQVNTIWWIYLFGSLALNSNLKTCKNHKNKKNIRELRKSEHEIISCG
jgi:O-antigen ligase